MGLLWAQPVLQKKFRHLVHPALSVHRTKVAENDHSKILTGIEREAGPVTIPCATMGDGR